jgi:hypothetical protein
MSGYQISFGVGVSEEDKARLVEVYAREVEAAKVLNVFLDSDPNTSKFDAVVPHRLFVTSRPDGYRARNGGTTRMDTSLGGG